MKCFITLSLLIVFTTGKTQELLPQFGEKAQKEFQQYDSLFQSYLIYYQGGYQTINLKRHLRVIGQTKGQWYLIDHYFFHGKDDSILKKPLPQMPPSFSYLKTHLDSLKSEQAIVEPCFSKGYSVNGQDTAGWINALSLQEHLATDVVVYKLDGRKGSIEQWDAFLAISICPLSRERKLFVDLINLIRN